MQVRGAGDDSAHLPSRHDSRLDTESRTAASCELAGSGSKPVPRNDGPIGPNRYLNPLRLRRPRISASWRLAHDGYTSPAYVVWDCPCLSVPLTALSIGLPLWRSSLRSRWRQKQGVSPEPPRRCTFPSELSRSYCADWNCNETHS